MNKLLLIGNGFDKAHNLPTSYSDFINNFWSNLHLKYQNDFIKEFVSINQEYNGFFNFDVMAKNFQDFWHNIIAYGNDKGYAVDNTNYDLRKTVSGFHKIFEFKNNLFKKITVNQKFRNWVDIEDEYYRELKRIVNQPKKKIKMRNETEEEFSSRKKTEVTKLNKDFQEIKKLLETYLIEEVENKYDFNKFEDGKEPLFILDILGSIDLEPLGDLSSEDLKDQIERWSKEFSIKYDNSIIEDYYYNILDGRTKNIPGRSYLLSFNYTSTLKAYKSLLRGNKAELSYIHGELRNEKNEIIFGFGDEIDRDYEKIENIGDNEYLKNFKSFQYLNTNEYDSLLRVVDSGKFQVIILGHSCGLSDRVLLNTIFEHENCRSIKIYYHKKEDIDNYTDIVQNISRHFRNKDSMRKIIVNKTLCQPLPQGVRFKKKQIT